MKLEKPLSINDKFDEIEQTVIRIREITKSLGSRFELCIQQAKAEVAREIFEAYDSYIKLLGEEIDSLMDLAISHGWQSSRVEAGEKCRAGIQSLKSRFLKEKK